MMKRLLDWLLPVIVFVTIGYVAWRYVLPEIIRQLRIP